ncbi:sigma-70 family RNA polymerase sigma factor [Sporosarcina sp. Sa2YVA2]|uniref:Sigma-70 family RNA polymerase sigma factor n=1 Tax=Sporosarcina quadrami TaxID=2762234 RepID=A0ABR8UCB4_9BACL|nr:sigma-70 family RNA polymerase sigma factor [Sporosarcina quadrami]MBD7985670.1 sigma-70 family RNA polymerase sigma factor [Sporosarcina quadrami]
MDSGKMEEIIDEHGAHLLKMAYFYLRDRELAKDIVQEVFFAFYDSSKYEEQGKLRAYLTRLTVNRCKDHLRSWSFRNLSFSKEWIETIQREQDPLILNEEKTDIAIAIMKLPIKYREIIIFYYYEEYKMREIATLLGLSENTVKARMVKARKLLKIDLQADYWEVLSIE